MPEPLIPQYTFLPWLRRGAVRLVSAAPAKERLSVPLTLKVHGDGDDPETQTVERNAGLYGPGDVGGVDARAIVRTVPRAGARDFEANFLAAIEFYDEDFIWRYSAALPEGGGLKPWIWLVALSENEFRRQGISAGKLPVIEIAAESVRDAFPDPDGSAAWAHVHLNFGISATKAGEVIRDVQDRLDEDPNLGCCRLLCPRRLRPDTSYTAFLIPAFEKGRLAGLGHPEKEIDETPNLQPSWPKRTAVSGPVSFPVYYEWSFATSSAGDFESLARQLRPANAGELLGGGRLLDLREPGWGQQYRSQAPGRPHPGAVVLESALRVPVPTATDSSRDPQDQLYFGKDEAADGKFAAELAALVNLGATGLAKGAAGNVKPLIPGTSIEDDPFVVPPLYGSFYKDNKKIADGIDWYRQLNTNPVYRIAAATGTTVIQEGQEEYMDRAWDQLAGQAETGALVRRWQFSLQLSEALYARRLKASLTAAATTQADPAKTVRQSKVVNLFAPMHRALQSGKGGNFVHALTGSAFAATYSRSYAKVTRTGGPLMRRFKDKPSAQPFFITATAIPVPFPYLKNAIGDAIGFLNNPRPATGAVKNFKTQFDQDLRNRGLAGTEPLKEAFSAYFNLGELSFKTAPAPENGAMYQSLAGQVKPCVTLPARMRSILGLETPASAAEAEKIDIRPQAVEFPEPMYAAMAARDPNLILPSLERIPPNSVTVMEPNAAFIESYLIGLNHEMAREFLWREFPAALDGTFFRQFWDVRNNPAAAVRPGQFKDITPVRGWPVSALGAATHRPADAASAISVIIIRGDLLRKYPNTLVFIQKAVWKNNRQRTSRVPGTELKMPVFSARIAPDYALLGFDVAPAELKGDPGRPDMPGWFFGLKERVGEAHFGLDLASESNDPAWDLIPEVAENQCVDAGSASFRKLPRYTSGGADRIAALLLQKPFLLLVHAGQLIG